MNLRSCLATALTVAICAGCGSASSSKAAAGLAVATHSAAASTIAAAAATSGSTAAAASTAPAATASAAASSAQASATAPASAPAVTSAPPVAVGGGSSSDFCKTIATTEGILTTAATAPHDPSLPQMLKRLHALAASAPSAIRSDLAAIADFDQKVVDGLARGKFQDIAETPQLKAALLHEALWVQKNCA